MTEFPQRSEYELAWRAAVDLRRSLLSGGRLPTLRATPIRVPDDDVPHAHLLLQYSRWYATTVGHSRSSTLAFGSPAFIAGSIAASVIGNNLAKNRAEAQAAAQWRDFQPAQVVLTGRRCLITAAGQWLTFDHERVMEVIPMLNEGSLVLTFSAAEPLRLTGPWASWLTVALVHLIFGTAQLGDRPDMALFGAGAQKTLWPG